MAETGHLQPGQAMDLDCPQEDGGAYADVGVSLAMCENAQAGLADFLQVPKCLAPSLVMQAGLQVQAQKAALF